MGRVYTAGLVSGSTYDKEVWGITQGEMLQLRRHGAAAHRIGGKGHDLGLSWLIAFRASDPVYLRMAPLLRYRREWWWATDPTVAPSAALRPPELRRIFEAGLRRYAGRRPGVRG